ncbi:hypothetical protein E3G68_005294 [Mycobacteroides abscessus]|uniref:LppA family lipoprotein n=1 Tax=Mycobacteroides abscessus TaxID=36809 RepID=UPI001C654E5C|nr:hypothetical protein [Mycobacteroides abscessus]
MEAPCQPTDPADASKAASELTSLPSLEDTRAQLAKTIEQVGQQISSIAPEVRWDWRLEDSHTGCMPPFEQSQGQETLLAKYVSDVPIAEQYWQQTYEVAMRAANHLGLTEVTTFKNALGDHDVQFSGDSGMGLRLGSQKAALLTGHTGCRLALPR